MTTISLFIPLDELDEVFAGDIAKARATLRPGAQYRRGWRIERGFLVMSWEQVPVMPKLVASKC